MSNAGGKTVAVILAAGQSTRMNTRLPKVLHEVCGRPMLDYVIDACRSVGTETVYVVVGYGKEQIIEKYTGQDDLVFVEQTERRGTGHAVMMCREYLEGQDGQTLILCGDAPLIRRDTLQVLLDTHLKEASAVTVATAEMVDPHGYGRVIRDAYGNIQGITEHNDCTEEQRKIREINTGYFCYKTPLLLEALGKITPNNVKNEYYLTDALHVLLADGHKATAVTAVAEEDAMGVNNRQQLSEVGKIMQQRIQSRLMADGVTIVDPPNTWIDDRALIGQDTVIEPFTCINGRVRIGRDCRIGPFAYVQDGTVLEDGVEVGVFTDVRNACFGAGSRVESGTIMKRDASELGQGGQ